MTKPGALFEPVVDPHPTMIPQVVTTPTQPSPSGAGVPPEPPRAGPGETPAPAPAPSSGGRHSVDADHWDDMGTVPLRLSELGVRPTAQPGGGRRRRPEPPAPRSRIASLDGLRGVAALVVVLYHVFLTQPALAAPYLDPAADVDAGTWWAAFTPLHLFWAGPEAVLVFFVLSGLVLALPVADSGRLNPWDYYPRRLVRLYLPVWAAIGLAVLWATAFPRAWPAGTSWWIAEYATDPTVSKVLADMFLLWSPGQANHVLWSLQWEVVYCLMLPLVLIAVRRFPQLWAVKLGAVVGTLVLGAVVESMALSSLALFVLGTLMAVEHRRLAGWGARLDAARHAGLYWSAALAACVVALLSYWFVHALGLPAGVIGPVAEVARALQGLGAGLVVFVVWHWSGAQRVMTSAVMQWLGSRSFSLYLVHLPIAASATVALGGQPPLLLVLALTLMVALPVTELFYRLVERPSHRVARLAGRSVADRVRSVPAPEVAPAIAETGPIRRIPAARGMDSGGAAQLQLAVAPPRRSPDAFAGRPGSLFDPGTPEHGGRSDVRIPRPTVATQRAEPRTPARQGA